MENLVVNPSSQQQPRSAPNNSANDPNSYVQGYPKLAYFFSQCPRYLHLRSFSALSTRVQLYRQHELVLLEKRLLQLERETFSARRSPDCNDYAHLKYGSIETDVGPSEQRDIYEMIKIELKEYGEQNSTKNPC